MDGKIKKKLLGFAGDERTPFFVFFQSKPADRFIELKNSFGGLAKHVSFCYSVKTNPFPGILAVLSSCGSGFEVVSERELLVVRSLNAVKVFNSISATPDELDLAVKQNALIVIDSLSVASLLNQRLKNAPLDVGLRVRFSNSKFGFSPSEVKNAIEELKKLNLFVTILHSHCGTNVSLDEYRNFISKLSELALGFPFLKGLDIGGGIPGKATLKSRSQSLSDYASVVNEFFGDFLSTRSLFLECGRFLSEDSFVLVTKVHHIKLADGKQLAVLDCGINVLSKLVMSPFSFVSLSEKNGKKSSFLLAGPLMFGSDKLGHFFGEINQGDFLAVENTGAYCMELGWSLSYDLPKIVVSD